MNPIPEEYEERRRLCVKEAARAIEFYKSAFGAREVMRMAQPDRMGRPCRVAIGAAAIMLADEYPEMNFRSPPSIGGTPVNILVLRRRCRFSREARDYRWSETFEDGWPISFTAIG